MQDEYFMSEALKEARQALEEGEVPVGAVVVYDSLIIGRGHNRREAKKDVSSHAEIEALTDAGAKKGSWKLEGATLYVTLEPCLMCASAIVQSRLFRLVYGCDDPQEGAVYSRFHLYEDPTIKNRPLLTRGVEEKECADILQEFFSKKRK